MTTVQLSKSIVAQLNRLKRHSRESYNDVISEMIGFIKKAKSSGQYDTFLHEAQKAKMTELWDNPEDEAWEHA
ncbi:MAG: hypothetical protein Q8P02_00025 [Candidatus Micrarchaeota archaeon]|nr:hypothetical protein [Candidatus Micrarchaeota archaeon]